MKTSRSVIISLKKSIQLTTTSLQGVPSSPQSFWEAQSDRTIARYAKVGETLTLVA